jgi:methanogenic corrinoid protein MtbC1
MLADVLRGAGLHVVDLGADVPQRSFLDAAATSLGPLTVGISLSAHTSARAAAATIASIKRAHPDALLLAGGPALTDRSAALKLGAHEWAANAVEAARLLTPPTDRTSSSRSPTPKDVPKKHQ